MAFLPRPVTMMMLVRPAATASSITYWMIGLSTRGSISFGCALVAGRKRVPRPAAGKTALRSFMWSSGIIARRPAAGESGVILPAPVLDLRYVVENRERVVQSLATRGVRADELLARGDLWSLDERRRAALQRVEQLRHRQRV